MRRILLWSGGALLLFLLLFTNRIALKERLYRQLVLAVPQQPLNFREMGQVFAPKYRFQRHKLWGDMNATFQIQLAPNEYTLRYVFHPYSLSSSSFRVNQKRIIPTKREGWLLFYPKIQLTRPNVQSPTTQTTHPKYTVLKEAIISEDWIDKYMMLGFGKRRSMWKRRSLATIPKFESSLIKRMQHNVSPIYSRMVGGHQVARLGQHYYYLKDSHHYQHDRLSGQTTDRRGSALYAWDGKKQTSISVPIQHRFLKATLVAFRGNIYLLGGLHIPKKIERPSNTVLSYHPATRTWKRHNPMPASGENVFAFASPTGIYVYMNKLSSRCSSCPDTLYRYEPKQQKWTLLQKYPRLSHQPQVLLWKQSLLLYANAALFRLEKKSLQFKLIGPSAQREVSICRTSNLLVLQDKLYDSCQNLTKQTLFQWQGD